MECPLSEERVRELAELTRKPMLSNCGYELSVEEAIRLAATEGYATAQERVRNLESAVNFAIDCWADGENMSDAVIVLRRAREAKP